MLCYYDFVIELSEAKKYPADRPSWQPDYEIGYGRLTARPLATLGTTAVEPYDDLLQEMETAQAIQALAADVKRRIVGTPNVDIPDQERINEPEESFGNE